MIVFGLQEVIDLENITLAAEIMLFASGRHEVSPAYRRWRAVLTEAVESRLIGYKLVMEAKLVGVSRCQSSYRSSADLPAFTVVLCRLCQSLHRRHDSFPRH